jgi:lambda family phage portal protein
MSYITEKLDQAKAYLRERGIDKQTVINTTVSGVGKNLPVHHQSKLNTAKRSFSGASANSVMGDWGVTFQSVNHSLYRGLRILRRRARELAANNDYMKQYVGMMRDNVVGALGVQFQSQAPEQLRDRLESAWTTWGKKGNCDVTADYSWLTIQKLVIRHMAVDGEVLVRFVYGKQYLYGFALQLIDPQQLDESYNADLSNGNKVRLGVETDEMGKRQGYWLIAGDLGDPLTIGSSLQRIRVPADEIIHLFIPEAIGQLRGIPPSRTAMIRMGIFSKYEEYELTASGLATCKSIHYKRDPNASTIAPLYETEQDSQTDLMQELEPGIGILPPGWSIESFDPTHPNQNYQAFMKSCLRGIACGLEVNYNHLGNDAEGVSFGTLRQFSLNERDVWMGLQVWMISELCERVYSLWLKVAMLKNAIPGISGYSEYDALLKAYWQGRRWDWMDPLKDTLSKIHQIEAGLTSRAQVIREQGGDPEKLFLEWEAENKRFGLPPSDAVSGSGSRSMIMEQFKKEMLHATE